MQHLKLFSSILVSACLLVACSGNSTTKSNNGDPSGSPTLSVSGSGSDMFYEYKLTTQGKNMSIQTDTKMYISAKGDMRTEMHMSNSLNPHSGSSPIIAIGHEDKPDESISIDDSAKTFSIIHFKSGDINTGEKIKTISVTKVGEEKILGYNSVHARVIVNKSIFSDYSSVDTFDIWRSNDVPVLASIKELFDKYEAKTWNTMYPADVAAQLKQMGCDGFMTKMEIHSKGSSTVEELVKVEHQDLPASMFEISADYKEDKNGM